MIIGVMGPGKDATEEDIAKAFEVGKAIAENGWTTLTGGVKSGVMDSALRGAKEGGGTTIGILPTPDVEISEAVDIPIITDLGSARNTINVLTSDVIVAIGINAGTSSEISFSLQSWANRPVILVNCSKEGEAFYSSLRKELVHKADSPQEVVDIIKNLSQ